MSVNEAVDVDLLKKPHGEGNEPTLCRKNRLQCCRVQWIIRQRHQLFFTHTNAIVVTLNNQAEIWCVAPLADFDQ